LIRVRLVLVNLNPINDIHTQFAAVKLPKCLDEPYNTYDRSTTAAF